MEFADPFALLLALFALPVVAVSFWSRRAALPVASGAAFDGLAPTWRLRFARALPVLRVVAVVLFAIALARPRLGDANAVVPAQGVDIALSLDISSSMTTSLLGSKQNRLEATKDVIRKFIQGRKDDRIGFVVFQKDALAVAPPTLDYDALDKIVAQVESGILPDGTGIGVGIAAALNMLRDSTAASRVVILLTDGQHNTESITPEEAARLAASLRIKVYTIGVVNARPAPGKTSPEIDEDRLRGIADITGGRYFLADSPAALAGVYDEIGRLETSAVGREHFEKFTELAPWFLAGAVLLLVLDLGLGATWLRRVPA
jgi:Ca-activated chloride channel family protein